MFGTYPVALITRAEKGLLWGAWRSILRRRFQIAELSAEGSIFCELPVKGFAEGEIFGGRRL
jgi:hypothetical protein